MVAGKVVSPCGLKTAHSLYHSERGMGGRGASTRAIFPFKSAEKTSSGGAAVLREAAQIDQLPFHSCRRGLTGVGIIGGNSNVLLSVTREQLERSSPHFPAGEDVVIICKVKPQSFEL